MSTPYERGLLKALLHYLPITIPVSLLDIMFKYAKSELHPEALVFTPGKDWHTKRSSCICLRQQTGAVHFHGPHCDNGKATWICQTTVGGFDKNSKGHSHFCFLNDTLCVRCKYSSDLCRCV
jgi:hypothetical protein